MMYIRVQAHLLILQFDVRLLQSGNGGRDLFPAISDYHHFLQR